MIAIDEHRIKALESQRNLAVFIACAMFVAFVVVLFGTHIEQRQREVRDRAQQVYSVDRVAVAK